MEVIATTILAVTAIVVIGVRWGFGGILPNARSHEGGAPILSPSREAQWRWWETGLRIGDVNAPIKVVEFANFTCGHCAELHGRLAAVAKRFPGQIGLAWHHYTMDEGRRTSQAQLLAFGAECAAAQGRFEAYHEAAFSAPLRVATHEAVDSLAGASGVTNLAAFRKCLASESVRDKVLADTREARALGFPGTPTWFLNGRMVVGAMPTDSIIAMIETTIRESRGEPAGSMRDKRP